MPIRFALALSVAAAAGSLALRADDWPQWMGPKRDNVWREDGVLDKFPAGGPKVVWRTEIAGGYAGPAVADGRVFVSDYVTKDNVKVDNFKLAEFSGTERLLALSEKDGAVLWKHEYPVKYKISYPAGPRCTPVVDDGKVYFLGAEGMLSCRTADKGTLVWEKDLKATYKAKTPLWGYAAHPLVDGKKLITLAGGEGSHVVALDKATGAEIWKSQTSPEQGYCPPTIITAGGKRQLVLLRPNAVTSLDPETGEKYWSVPYEATNGSIIMSPVVSKDYLFAGGYLKKNLLLKLDAEKPAAEVVWRDKKGAGISPVNVQPFVDGETLYGFNEDGEMFGVEVASGKRVWTGTGPLPEKPAPSGTAFIVRQGDRYWLFAETGDLVIAKLSPKGYEEIDRAKILDPTNNAFGRKVVWCAPAFANKRAYLRNDKEIVCVDLAK